MTRKAGILLVYLAVSVIVLEALLHVVPLPDPHANLRNAGSHRFHLFLPGWNVWTSMFDAEPPFARTFVTGPLVGVSTTRVVVNVNRFGFLYDEEKATRQSNDEIRIGVVGGSTVECSALEQGKRWPDVLETTLHQHLGLRVAVVNLGVSGMDSRTYLATVAQHAVKLNLDYLVFMLGANDLFRANSVADPLLRDDAFQSPERTGFKTFLLRFQLARRMRVLLNRLRGTDYYVASGDAARPYFVARIGELSNLPVLPDARITIASRELADYQANIVSLSALAVAHGITPIFTTQPMLWKANMSSAEQAVDWLVGTVLRDGRRYRAPSQEQAYALESLNRRLLETCAGAQLLCIDIEKQIPRSLDFFYDSLHFNEAGSKRVAQHIADFLAEHRRSRLPNDS